MDVTQILHTPDTDGFGPTVLASAPHILDPQTRGAEKNPNCDSGNV